MKKVAVVLGVAAVATITGCKDPEYAGRHRMMFPQDEVKSVETTPAPIVPEKTAPVAIADTQEKHCTCAPGTVHTTVCTCGAADCMCVVETKAVAPVEPEYTVYVVQNGDFLSKISKKYNVTISSLRRINGLKNDTIRVGQKLKIPGKVNVEAPVTAPKAQSQKSVKSYPKTAKPVAKPAKAAAKAPAPTTYTGPTKEYVVKAGDTMGAIAYSYGINIRQLKALNGMKTVALRVGQKIKVPAEKVVKPAKADDAKASKAEKEVKAPAKEAPAPAKAEEKLPDAPADNADLEPEPEKPVAAPAPAAQPKTTNYVVQEGDDMASISIAYGVSAAVIRELNNLGEGDALKVGQTIKLPADAQP